MCEFNVMHNGGIVFKDVVYAKVDKTNVTVRDVLGQTKEFESCKIVEVDVNNTRLVIESV